MKKRNKRVLLTAIMLLGLCGLTSLQAQETFATAGSTSGTMSYTVGQTVYTTEIDINGNSITQGVQQPYEISVITGIPEANGINLSVSAYPNPTTYNLTVKVEDYKTANLQYVVFDTYGKLLQAVKATGSETQIEISNLPAATYFLKVLENQKEIKVFKIIKN